MSENNSAAVIAELEKQVLVAEEMLALVLNETGPVTVERKSRVKLPANTQIVIDINPESETVTFSLGVAE